MKVEVETISPVKRSLSVEVGSDIVGEEFASAYAELSRRVKISGFRPGKVPLAILEKRYHQEIADDVVRRLIPRFYEEAVKEVGLVPVQLPTIDHVSVAKDAPLSFRATVEVRPPISLQPYRDLPLVRRPITVTEADVAAVLDSLRQRQGQLEGLGDDHVVVEGDYVVIDFEGTVDGQPVPETAAKGYLVHVGAKALVPEIEAALAGHRKGDRFETAVAFLPDHRNARLAGRLATFQVAVVEVKRQVLPELDDDFAKDLGMESLAVLRATVRQDIERRKREEQRLDERQALLKTLLERHQVELPPSLVQREAVLVRDRITRHLHTTGADLPGPEADTLQRQADRVAEERVKGDLLLETIAERERLQVDEGEIEREIERLARDTKSSVREVRKLLAGESGTFGGLRATLLREKTLDWLHAQAQIREEEGSTSGQAP
ncbi:MAG: trigger factor [Nitrospirae bacterium]|nr:trigger factor [Nitrospirota bacterium]